MNKSHPVFRVLAPAGCDTSPFCQPGKGTLDHPATGRECFFTGERTFCFGFISLSFMFDMLNVAMRLNDLMNILKIIASVGTKMLFAVRSFGEDMHDQVLHRPLVVFIGSCDPNG